MADLGHAREIKSLGWPENALGSPLEELVEVAGERSAWASVNQKLFTTLRLLPS